MKKTKKILALVVLLVGLAALIIPNVTLDQAVSSRRELQRHDLGIPGREVLQAIVTIGHGETSLRHKHPGEEIIYVLEGSLQYDVDGKLPVTLKAGEVLFIANGKIHTAKNVGSGKASELATYIVEKGKPLIEIEK